MLDVFVGDEMEREMSMVPKSERSLRSFIYFCLLGT